MGRVLAKRLAAGRSVAAGELDETIPNHRLKGLVRRTAAPAPRRRNRRMSQRPCDGPESLKASRCSTARGEPARARLAELLSCGSADGRPARFRSRVSFRSLSRFASVIDRSLQKQNTLKNRKTLESSSRDLVVRNILSTAPEFCGPKFLWRRRPSPSDCHD